MKRIATLFAAVAIIATIVPAAAQKQTYRINVGDFHELTVADGVPVRYVSNPDSAGIVTFEADPDVASMIMFTPNNFKLKISISDECQRGTKIPRVTVYSTIIDRLSNWGDSTVVMSSLPPASSLKVKVIGNGQVKVHDLHVTKFEASIQTGNGTIFATGQASGAKYINVGSGTIQASGVKADKVNCKIAGVGSIDCYATEELSVFGMGSGNVYYLGNPKIKRTALGVKVISMNE